MEPDLIARHVSRCAQPMAWGVDDCAIWAGDVLLEQTGDDLMAAWRGRYSSQEEAEALMGARGGGLVRHVMRAVHAARWHPVKPAKALGPSLGLFRQTMPDGTWANVCCVFAAAGWFIARGDGAATHVPADLVRRAWSW